MCSIIGYTGKSRAAPILVKGLKRMEYRGYDSVGVATSFENCIKLKKDTGKVDDVDAKMNLASLSGTTGIGHTRWATHGKITSINAHPHPSNSGGIAIVHNGIVENFEKLKAELVSCGYDFKSETDSEVIANLLEKNYKELHNIKSTILKTVSELRGHYSFVAMFQDGQLAAARFHEPLIIGVGRDSYFLTSDVLGFIEQTDDAIYMDNGNVAIVDQSGLEIVDFDGNNINYEITKVSKEFADAYKGDYAHFTIKEISEQPQTIIRASNADAKSIAMAAKRIKDSGNLYITGSGSSYNAAFIGRQLFSKHAKIKAEHLISSELQFLSEIIEPNSTLIAISQSGESADVLEAVEIAKKECQIISITNRLTSSLARESDVIVGMNCGPEIGVAATKSFTAQVIILYRILQEITEMPEIDFTNIAGSVADILKEQSLIKKIASDIKGVSDIYILGRGIHYPIAIESALKLKELAYIHAEGIAGGELKHGPLALIDSSVFAIVINPNDSTYTDTITSARQLRSRGAKIIGISDVKSDAYDYWIKIPKTDELAYIVSEIIPIQLLSYYAALEKDTDPDHPRNLAKSVTVK